MILTGKCQTKIARSFQMVLARSNVFENKEKVAWRSGKILIEFTLYLSFIQQTFDYFVCVRQCRRPVQTDLTFVQQICRTKSLAKVETV